MDARIVVLMLFLSLLVACTSSSMSEEDVNRLFDERIVAVLVAVPTVTPQPTTTPQNTSSGDTTSQATPTLYDFADIEGLESAVSSLTIRLNSTEQDLRTALDQTEFLHRQLTALEEALADRNEEVFDPEVTWDYRPYLAAALRNFENFGAGAAQPGSIEDAIQDIQQRLVSLELFKE